MMKGLLVSVMIFALCAACGGESEAPTPTPQPATATARSTPTPDSNEPLPVTPQTATPDGSSNATAGPSSTSTPVSGSTGQFRREIQEFVDALCSFDQKQFPETWGEMVKSDQSFIEHVEGLRTPGELRATVEAILAQWRYWVDWGRGLDPNEEFKFSELVDQGESDEYKALEEARQREGLKLDTDVYLAIRDCS